MSFNIGDIVEAYTIEKSLSDKGGMSKIYLAYETLRPSRRVVLKVQRTGHEESLMFQDLLREESALLQKLNHPGIIRIIPMRMEKEDSVYIAKAINYEDTPWYYAMPYLGEYTLEKHINLFPEDLRMNTKNPSQDLGVYSIDWSIELFYQVLQVINYMHEKRIAHTDLKPDNLILRHVPTIHLVPQPILIDFGSACAFDGMKQLTASPGYSPPEVMKAVKYDMSFDQVENVFPEKIDIWSLGVILFELLTGRKMRPAQGMGIYDTTLVPIRSKKVSRYRIDVHDSIDKLLQAMLANDPLKRPGTAQIMKAIDERIYSIRPPRIDNRRLS